MPLLVPAELRAHIETDRDDPTLITLEADAEQAVIAKYGSNFPDPVTVERELMDLSLVPSALLYLERPVGMLLALTTALGVPNADLVFTSRTPGVVPTIAYVVAGVNTPLSVAVSGSAITVNLATNGAGAATSTAAQIAAAIAASAAASALVTVTNVAASSGAGVVPAMANAPLVTTVPAIAAITTITEYWGDPFSESVSTLVPTDYRVLHGGRTLERLGNSTNARWIWGHRVAITYIPVDDTAQRKRVIVDLVKLALRFSGVRDQSVGDVRESGYDSYTGARQDVIDSLGISVAFS